MLGSSSHCFNYFCRFGHAVGVLEFEWFSFHVPVDDVVLLQALRQSLASIMVSNT